MGRVRAKIVRLASRRSLTPQPPLPGVEGEDVLVNNISE
jgi:hypothetical protein